ncbi:MAG TPA: S9 family peptidase [Polyangiaceae bacterium]|nr:S9 family peptidase [Polyangiaceae bacterium]
MRARQRGGAGRSLIGPDDLFRLRFLRDAKLSPDGLCAAGSVLFFDEPGEAREALFLYSLATGEERPIGHRGAGDRSPRFTPDGRWILFLSSRSGAPQIYRMSAGGGEASALTALPRGVASAPLVSPDGRRVAFTAKRAEKSAGSRRIRRALYRVDEVGYLEEDASDLFIMDVEGGNPTRLDGGGHLIRLLGFSPDGGEVLFTASFPPGSHDDRARLRVARPGDPARDLAGGFAPVEAAAFLPDGERIAFIGAPAGSRAGSKLDLWVMGRDGGAPERRTGGLREGVGGALQADMPALVDRIFAPEILVSERSGEAFVQAQIGGQLRIVRVALEGPEKWVEIAGGDRACVLLDRSGEKLLFAQSRLDDPVNLCVIDPEEGERQVTRINAELLSSRALPSLKRIGFEGEDGAPIEGWVLLPAGIDPPYPTLLAIHGGPHLGWGHVFSFDFQMLAGAGYAVVFVNQRGSTGYGDDHATRILGDWGNLDYNDLMAAVDHVIAAGIADPARLGCFGLSGGGFLAAWIVGHTDRFRAAVAENPATDWVSFYGTSDIGRRFSVNELGGEPHEIPEVYRRCSPITYAHRAKTPTLLIQGEADLRCPPGQSEQLYTILKASGCEVELLYLPDSAHMASVTGPPAIQRAQNEALLEWMDRFVR